MESLSRIMTSQPVKNQEKSQNISRSKSPINFGIDKNISPLKSGTQHLEKNIANIINQS